MSPTVLSDLRCPTCRGSLSTANASIFGISRSRIWCAACPNHSASGATHAEALRNWAFGAVESPAIVEWEGKIEGIPPTWDKSK